ncbi:MAG: phosphonate ABC transporter, permease protein PhnE, partial [Eubacteriales bacterium]|nr:phosphonate ABC transporter, permease protein PhnE [Eubacteriales bacterium]
MQKALNPIEEMYESRPRRWWMYTLIIFIMAVLLSWSANAIQFKGLAAKGSEVAYGIVYGIFHPDTSLLINSTKDGVPYLLFETVAIAVLGTLIGGLLAVPVSFLASENVV